MDNVDTLSFVLLQSLDEDATCAYATDSILDLLGWDPKAEIVGRSFYDLVHPDEVLAAKNLHYEHIRDDMAATLTYLRLRHKTNNDYVLCALSRSVAYNCIVATIARADDDPGGARAAMAKGGRFVLTPGINTAVPPPNWNRNIPASAQTFRGSPSEYSVPIGSLPRPSMRVCILLDRFRSEAFMLHASNDMIIPPGSVLNHNLLNFIPAEADRIALLRAIHVVKNWSTHSENTADGIHGTCRFTINTPSYPNKLVDGILSATSDAVLLVLIPSA